jgi:hypothetical protein
MTNGEVNMSADTSRTISPAEILGVGLATIAGQSLSPKANSNHHCYR